MPRTLRLIMIVAIVALGITAIAVVAWQSASRHRTIYTDGRTIREPASSAQVRDVLWSPAAALPESINSPQIESEPCISADGSMLLFVRGGAESPAGVPTDIHGDIPGDIPGDIWVSMRSEIGEHGWSAPFPLNAINSNADDRSPALSPDGTVLYFASNRAGGEGGYDLWMSLREGQAWLEPVNLGPQVNSPHDELDVAADIDDGAIFLASNRPIQLDGTAPGDTAPQAVSDVPSEGEPPAQSASQAPASQDSSFNLFMARRGIDGAFGSPAAIDAINTPAAERSPALSPAGDFLYLASDRPGGEGSFDLYRARIVEGGVQRPSSLGPTINTAGDELDPAIAMEGFALYFSKNAARRTEHVARSATPDDLDLFIAISREVYRDREAGWFSLASLADVLWPLLWALVALALILALLALLRSSYARQIGLLARCVIASLLVHCLLMLGFMIWQVSTGIADFMREGAPTRVSLITSASKSELSGQLRGQLVDAPFDAEPLSTQRSMTEPQPVAAAPESYDLAATAAATVIEQTRLEQATAPDSPSQAPDQSTPLDRQATTFELASARAEVSQPQPAPQSTTDEASNQAQPAAPGPAQRQASRAPIAPAEAESTNDLAAPSAPLPTQLTNHAVARTSAPEQTSVPYRSDPQPMRDATIASPRTLEPQTDLQTPTVPETPPRSDALSVQQVATQLAGRLQSANASRSEPTTSATAAASPATVTTAAPAPEAPLPAQQRLPTAEMRQARESQPLSAIEEVPTRPTDDAVEPPRILTDLGTPSDARATDPAAPVDEPPSPPATFVASTDQMRDRVAPAASQASPSFTQADAAAPETIDIASVPPQRMSEAPTEAAAEARPTAPSTTVASAATLELPASAQLSDVSLPAPQSDQVNPADEHAVAASIDAPSASPRQMAAANATSPASESIVALDAPAVAQADRATLRSAAASPRAVDAPSEASSSAPRRDEEILPVAVVDVPVAMVDAAVAEQPAAAPEQLPAAVVAAKPSEAARYDVPVAPPAAAAVARLENDTDRLDAEQVMPKSRATMTSTEAPVLAASETALDVPRPEMTEPELAARELDVPLPREIDQPYSQRAPDTRAELVQKMGGSVETERAVELALQWLAAHQHTDGRWDADGFDRHCGKCGGEAAFDADVATTGLALLCFLAADHSHVKAGPYRDNVRRAVTWLTSQQREGGDLRRTETMYSHAIATIALAETFGMTRDESLRPIVESAVDFMIKARNKQIGGWRYEPGQAGDTSVIGWVVMGFISARRAGLPVPEEVFDAAREWLEVVSTRRDRGLYAYQPGQKHTPAMTAEGLFVQQLLGRKRHETRMIQAADFLVRNLPDWSVEANSYYWYYGTLAMYQHQGDAWEKWNQAMTREILAHQNTTGEAAGSWDPTDRWSLIGGRIYQTALCTLSLEVYYRYLPLYSRLIEQ